MSWNINTKASLTRQRVNADRIHRDEKRVYAQQHIADAKVAEKQDDLLAEQADRITDQDREIGAHIEARSATSLKMNEYITKINNLTEKNDTQAAMITKGVEQADSLELRRYELQQIVDNDPDRLVLDSLNKRVTHLQNQAEKINTAVEVIGETANELAEENGWCDEYDELQSQVNAALARKDLNFELPDRTNNYYVTLSLNVYVEDAKSEEIAQEMAIDSLNSGSLSDCELDRYNISVEQEE